MFQLRLALPQNLLLLHRFVEFIPCIIEMRQLALILLLVFVLQILKNRIYIVAHCVLHSVGFVVLNHIYLLEYVGIHRIVLSGLLEFFLCCPEHVNIFVLLQRIQFGTMRFLLKHRLLCYVFIDIDMHPLEILMLQNSRIKKVVLCSSRPLS